MLEIQRHEATENTVGNIRSDRRLCLAADDKTMVEADDPRAVKLLCAAGHEISAKHAAELRLMIIDGHVVQHPSIGDDSAAIAEEAKRRESVAAAARQAQEESLASAKQKAEAMGGGPSVEAEDEIPVIDASQSDEDLVTQFELEALEKGYGDAAAHHIALQRLAHLRGGGDGYGLAPIPDAVEPEQPQPDPSTADEKQREPGEDKSRVPEENKGKGRGGKNKETK
jgi:hypothetical protein